MTASIVMVVRHAEKPNGDVAGVLLNGSQDAESLIVQGWQRAGALAVLFDPSRGSLQDSVLAVPQFLFAAKFEPTKHSQRPFETIQPLSLKLNLTINDGFRKDDYGKMVPQALASCSSPGSTTTSRPSETPSSETTRPSRNSGRATASIWSGCSLRSRAAATRSRKCRSCSWPAICQQ